MQSTSKTRNPLDLTGDDFAAMMAEIVPPLSAFLDRLPQSGISFPSGATEFLKQNADVALHPPAEQARPLRELLEVIVQAAENDINAPSGGALAFIPGSGLVASAAADLIAGVFNRYTALSVVSPAMVALETEVLQWLTSLMGFPGTAGGLLTSGASMAIFSAVVCARNRLPENFLNGVIYTTNQTHHCLPKAMRLAGFPSSALRLVPADEGWRMDVRALRAMIIEDRAAGYIPLCIAANAGTTNTGTIDPLKELAAVAREENVWFHIDAAYGGFFQLTNRGRNRLSGIEQADSIVVDFHKGMFLPFGTGCLLVRDREILHRAHANDDAPVLRDLQGSNSNDVYLPDFAETSPELTRPNRGLRVWLPLHLHGVAAFRKALDEKLDLAEHVYHALKKMPQIQVLAEPELSVVAFYCRDANGSQAEEDIATEELVRYVNRAGRVFLATTSIHERIVARIAILNVRTTAAIIEDVLSMICTYVEENAAVDAALSWRVLSSARQSIAKNCWFHGSIDATHLSSQMRSKSASSGNNISGQRKRGVRRESSIPEHP